MAPKKLLVNIFTHNRPQYFANTLMSLYAQSFRDFDILIVDDASTIPVDSIDFIRKVLFRFKQEGIGVEVVRSTVKMGIATNRSIILPELKKYKYVFDLNDDHYLDVDCIANMMDMFDNEDVCVVGSATPNFSDPNNKVFVNIPDKFELPCFSVKDDALKIHRYCDHIFMKPETKDPIIMGLVVDHASQFIYMPEYLNELPKDYSVLGYTEETDLCLRCKFNSGKKIIFCSHAVNWHMQAPVGGVRDEDNFKNWEALKQSDWDLFLSNWEGRLKK